YPAEFEGSQSPEQLYEVMFVTVTVYSRLKTDRAGTEEHLLRDSRRGLLQIKKRVLRALVGKDLEDEEGNHFLREFVCVRRAGRPEYDNKKGIGWLQLTFLLGFDWDLTTDVEP